VTTNFPRIFSVSTHKLQGSKHEFSVTGFLSDEFHKWFRVQLPKRKKAIDGWLKACNSNAHTSLEYWVIKCLQGLQNLFKQNSISANV